MRKEIANLKIARQEYFDLLETCQSQAGDFLKMVRVCRGWSLRQLAIMLECDHSYISKVENGYEMISASMLLKLAEILNKEKE